MKIFCICSLSLLLHIKCVASESVNRLEHFNNNNNAPNVVIARDLAMAVVQMLRPSYITKQQQRTFNLYVHVQQQRGREQLFDDIVEQIMRSLDASISMRVGVNRALIGDNERHYNVLLIDSIESLRRLYENFAKHHLHVSGYFIIVLHTFDAVHYYDVLFGLFELNWLLGMIDVNVLVYALTNLVLLYSIVPFNQFHCKGLAPTIQNRFISSRWLHENFFPDKLANLYGCALICATWEDMPYFAVATRALTNSREYLGIEGKLLSYLARKMNFTLDFHFLGTLQIERLLQDERALFTEVFKNGTDFVMGALHYKPTKCNDPYAPTTVYYLSNLNFIVNAYASPCSPFTKLFLPFSTEIWCFFALIFICSAFISLLTKIYFTDAHRFILGHGNRTPLYNMCVVCLGGTLPQPPRRNFARYLLLLWLLATMVLRCAYQAFIFHYIKSSIGVAPPDTIDGLLQPPAYRLLMTDSIRDTVRDLPHVHAAAERLNGSEMQSFELLRQSERHRSAILTPYEYFGYYKRHHVDAANELRVVPQQVFVQQLSIYMRTNSLLLSRFNQYILDYLTAGLMAKWERELFGVSAAADKGAGEPARPIGLQELYGVVYVWLIGCALGLLTLLGELVVSRFTSVRRVQHHAEDP